MEAGGGGDGSFISSGIGADQNSVGKALAQARAAKLKPDGKSMTQKELATAVNAKPQDVSSSRGHKASRWFKRLGLKYRLRILRLLVLYQTSSSWASWRGLSVSS